MKILIVEDDVHTAEMVREGLTADSHTVDIASDGSDGSFLGRSYDYDVVVLDHSLPKKDGLTICSEIRAVGRKTPIIFLSVTDDMETKIAALDRGADDYMTKPFSFSELYARIRALARRPNELLSLPTFQVDDLVLDAKRQSVIRGTNDIRLTRKEFGLLEYFMRHVGVVLSRTLLMEHVWTADSDPFSNTIEAHIRNLRKKINVGGKPNLIVNIPGRGYVIERSAILAHQK